ncbi:hypothetical protein C8J57DRAFT_1095875 [Mycena rebaudengoi]|nr:hypothetical protein C8J57DRAFT_1095875 [Mycena rebaudengoi]
MSSSDSITAIAILENPRVIPKMKTTVLNAQIFLGSSEPALICNLHYFNANNIVFKDIPEAFVIILQGARALTDAQTYSQQLAALDYHIMGDIVWLVRLGSPGDFDICQRPYTHITGLPSNINKDDATFEVNVEQYIAATKSTKLFPARCLIPDTARFKNFKPVPSQGKCVSVMGHLSAVERDDNRAVKNFFIDVDNVIFLGQQGGGMPKAAESPMKLGTHPLNTHCPT